MTTARRSRPRKAGRAGHTLAERAAAAGSLPAGPQQVARFFVEHGNEVAFMSIMEIAAATHVSNATVVRTAQALGYSGLPELKRELRDTIRANFNPAVRVSHSLDELGSDSEQLLDHLFAMQATALAEARRSLAAKDFRKAVDLLLAAKRTIVLGVSLHEAPLAEYFAGAIRRFGRSAVTVTGRGRAVLDLLMDLGPGDVAVALAYEDVIPEMDVALHVIAQAKVPCILITDTLALALKGRYTVAISARRGDTGMAPTVTVTLVLLEALTFGIAAGDRGRSVAALERLYALRKKLAIPKPRL